MIKLLLPFNPPIVVNICFFCPEFKFPSAPEASGSGAAVGGMERASSLLAKELCRRGHHVEFYWEPPPRFHIPIVSAFLSSFFPSLFNRPRGTRSRKFLKEHKIDVAVWHKPGSVWSIPFSLKNLPCRLITLYHNTPRSWGQIYADNAIKKRRSRLAQRLVRSKPCGLLIRKYFDFCHNHSFSCAIRSSEKFVLLSEHFIPEFPQGKKFPEKVCAIANIVPFGVQDIDFSSKKKELLWVGRMVASVKQPHLLLHIWKKLQDRFPDWSLRFVGDGPYLPELKTLAKELDVQHVSFEGHQDPAPYYRSAPIFCFTSAAEGFGLVLVEAQAFGCVPLAFESYSSVRDIIEDGVNGYLIPPFDLDVYAEKLAQLMQDPELRTQLARNAQESVTKFSSEAVGNKWERLLKEISC